MWAVGVGGFHWGARYRVSFKCSLQKGRILLYRYSCLAKDKRGTGKGGGDFSVGSPW